MACLIYPLSFVYVPNTISPVHESVHDKLAAMLKTYLGCMRRALFGFSDFVRGFNATPVISVSSTLTQFAPKYLLFASLVLREYFATAQNQKFYEVMNLFRGSDFAAQVQCPPLDMKPLEGVTQSKAFWLGIPSFLQEMIHLGRELCKGKPGGSIKIVCCRIGV